MSGTFEELTVPPTLVAFGVTTADSRKVLSPEFKTAGENIYYIPGQALSAEIDFDLIKSNFAQLEDWDIDHRFFNFFFSLDDCVSSDSWNFC